MNDTKHLEREAIELTKQYGLFMPKAVKDFLRRMAFHLQWADLMKHLN